MEGYVENMPEPTQPEDNIWIKAEKDANGGYYISRVTHSQ